MAQKTVSEVMVKLETACTLSPKEIRSGCSECNEMQAESLDTYRYSILQTHSGGCFRRQKKVLSNPSNYLLPLER